MGKKNTFNTSRNSEYFKECPQTLTNNQFYGLQLDADQTIFRDAIWSDDYDIVFCNALSGSGKTLVAIATANLLYQYGKYDDILYIVSPTQEEKLGFLPGSAEEKISPYIDPVIDALIKLDITPESAIKQLSITGQKNGTAYINCISHSYLRGTNFDNKVVIIDEAQNMYFDDLKKTLTRINDESCKAIVIGHTGQCDLYKNPHRSGFYPFLKHFENQKRCAVCELTINHRGWVSRHADELMPNY